MISESLKEAGKSAEYIQGYKAAKRGAIPPYNPYPKDSQQYNDWLDGLIDGSI